MNEMAITIASSIKIEMNSSVEAEETVPCPKFENKSSTMIERFSCDDWERSRNMCRWMGWHKTANDK